MGRLPGHGGTYDDRVTAPPELPAPARRAPRWLVVLACVALTVEIVLASGVLVGRAARDRGTAADVRSAVRGADRLQQERAAAVRKLLEARSAALLSRDRVAFLALVDPTSPDFARRQAALFDNLRGVRLSTWSYDVDAERTYALPSDAAERYGAPTWVPGVRLRFALADHDRTPTAQAQFLTFVRRGDRWLIGADSDLEAVGLRTSRGLWDFGQVTAVRTARVLVLGHPGSLAVMQRILLAADPAVPRVTAVWGSGWPGRVVVLVPSSASELRAMVGSRGDLSRIAAVTSADPDPAGGPPTGERVVVNPGPFRGLGTFGRRVVLQHEITHVASRDATGAATPLWLAEGLADYVGYLDSGADLRLAAQELGAEVRAGRLPVALPTTADFSAGSRLSQAYQMAWLACRLIVERVGRTGLLRLYRAVGSARSTPEAAVDAGLRTELGMGTAEFTATWRAYLGRQLG